MVGIGSTELYPGLYCLLLIPVLNRDSTACKTSPLSLFRSQIFREQLFLSVMFCPWGTTELAVIELLFPQMMSWYSGKTAQKEVLQLRKKGVPKANTQTLLGLIRGSGHFLDLSRPEWNQEEGLTSSSGGGSDHQKRKPFLCVYLRLFQTVCLWSVPPQGGGEASFLFL